MSERLLRPDSTPIEPAPKAYVYYIFERLLPDAKNMLWWTELHHTRTPVEGGDPAAQLLALCKAFPDIVADLHPGGNVRLVRVERLVIDV
jgi:hypothetical protein